jgi:transposase
LRWHLHELDPTLVVPLRRLDRTSHIERVGRWLARRGQDVQVRIARELVNRCRSLTRQIDELNQELEQRTAAVAPTLLELPGCGAVTAAKLLAEIGPISRFKTDAQLARHSGVAPLEASSGKSQRHRLDRGGNRQLNAALYRIAITQSRYHPAARAYLERKQAEGKSKREAIRCLKRLLARTVFNALSQAGFGGDLDPRMSSWGEEILHGHVEIEEVSGGVAGAGGAAGVRVGPSDRARGG